MEKLTKLNIGISPFITKLIKYFMDDDRFDFNTRTDFIRKSIKSYAVLAKKHVEQNGQIIIRHKDGEGNILEEDVSVLFE